MKYLSILFIAIFYISCSTQKTKNPHLKGNWWFCNANQGYTEISISDSTVRYLSLELFGSFPSIIKENNNGKIITDTGLEIKYIDDSTALFSGNIAIDTIKKINEPVKLISDYKCNMGISRIDYENILLHEFNIREKKNYNNCPPTVLDRIKQNPATIVTIDDLLISKGNSITNDLEFTFEYRQTDTKKNSRLTYNSDSSRVLLEYSEIGSCNEGYRLIDSYLKKSGELILYTNNIYSGCQDSCVFNFYLLIEGLPQIDIKEVIINNEKITLYNTGYK